MPHPVPLNPVAHRHLRVVAGHGAAFGDAANQALVFPDEFEEVQREYAILLRRDEAGGWRFTALLGLEAGENLYLDGDRWNARYVPALHARGPFSIGVPAHGGEPMVHVDLDHPRVHSAGEPVFDADGAPTPLLDRATAALRRIYTGAARGAALIAAWSAYDLIAPVTLHLDLDDTRRVSVPDCFTIDAGRLAALDGAALERLNHDDLLRPAIWVSASLGNIRHLLGRKLRRETL